MAEQHPNKSDLLFRSLVIAGGLTIFKLFIFFVTNSLAILTSAADSLMDLVVSLANFMLVRQAMKPADQDHPYGHGKIESLAGLLQSLVLGGVAVGLGAAAVRRFLHPQPITEPWAGVGVMAAGLLLNIWHVRNLRVSMTVSGSSVMASEYLHYAADILSYVGVVLSLLLFRWTGSLIWDPLISLLIVAYLLKNVVQIFNNALVELLDKQLPDALLAEIDRTIRHYHPKVIDYHDLRTRKVGPTKFIEFHVVLRGVQKFDEAHDLTEGLINELRRRYPDSVVTVHTDPEGALESGEPPPSPACN